MVPSKKQDRSSVLESDLGRLIEAHSDPFRELWVKEKTYKSPVEGDSRRD